MRPVSGLAAEQAMRKLGGTLGVHLSLFSLLASFLLCFLLCYRLKIDRASWHWADVGWLSPVSPNSFPAGLFLAGVL